MLLRMNMCPYIRRLTHDTITTQNRYSRDNLVVIYFSAFTKIIGSENPYDIGYAKRQKIARF